MTVLPSRVHPSYPYGDPKDIKHPASRPRPPFDPASRALFEDMGYTSHLSPSDSATSTFRWRDLALDILLPPDPKREEQERARVARRMANVAGTANQQPSVGANTTTGTQEGMNTTEVDGNGGEGEEDTDEEGEDDGEDEDEDAEPSEEGSED